jgi:hypothetical protein
MMNVWERLPAAFEWHKAVSNFEISNFFEELGRFQMETGSGFKTTPEAGKPQIRLKIPAKIRRDFTS